MIVGVGIDVVDNARMKIALQRQPKLVNKILTVTERIELGISADDIVHENESLVQSIAARFAAKEATVKSLHRSLFSVGLHNIEIARDEITGAPHISTTFTDMNVENHDGSGANLTFMCSMSHSQSSSVAVVIAQSDS